MMTRETSDIVAISTFLLQDGNSPPMYMHVALQNGHYPYQIPESYTKQYSYIDNKDRRALAGRPNEIEIS